MGVEQDAGAVDAGKAPPVGGVAAGHEVAAVVADDFGRFAGDRCAGRDVDGAGRRRWRESDHGAQCERRKDPLHSVSGGAGLADSVIVATNIVHAGLRGRPKYAPLSGFALFLENACCRDST